MSLSNLFKRQFLLSNREVNNLSGLKKITLEKTKMYAYIDADLSFTYLQTDKVEILLLGYVLSHQTPEKQDKDIVSDLAQHEDFASFIRATYPLCGRYLFLYINAEGTYLLPDTLRMRLAYYHFDSTSEAFYVATQCQLLRHYVPLTMEDDPDFLKFVYHPGHEQLDSFIVGDVTYYKEAKNLMPNHYLDFKERKAKRFFPLLEDNKPLAKDKEMEGLAERCNQMLYGFLKAIILRDKPVVIPFTAGWDSRLLVALSKNFKDQIQYYINQFPHMTDESADVWVPKKLSQRLGLRFEINQIKDVTVPKEFQKQYEDYDTPVERYMAGHYAQSMRYKDTVIMHTIGNEVAKCLTMQGIDDLPVTTVLLNRLIYYGNANAYVVRQSQKWLAEMQNRSGLPTIHLPELYAWENIEANFTATAINLGDTYRETCSIFNCREYITTMWTAPAKYRKSTHKLGLLMIRKAWAEVLSEPINPPTDLRGRVVKILKKLDLYDYLKRRELKKKHVD